MKYRVNDVTPNGALVPVPAGSSAAATTNGMIRVYGSPGTNSVPSPKPEALPAGPLVASAQPSNSSPNVFLPAIYYVHVNNLHPGNNSIRVKSNNEVPVPARPSNRVPGVAFRSARVGGMRQITWPPAPQVWQNVNGGQ